jgi:hypothetical protein
MSDATKYDHDRIAADRETETTTIGGLVFRRAKKNRRVTREIRKLDAAQERLRGELVAAEEADDKATTYQLVALLLIEDRDGGKAPTVSHLEEHVDQLDDLGPLTAWALGNDPDPTPPTASESTESTSS